MVSRNEVEIVVRGDTKDAEKKLGGLKKTFQGMSSQIKATGRAMTAFGAITVGIAALAVKSSMEQQVGINLLNQALINVGTGYDTQREAIERVIEAQQRKTNFGDEEQREALQKLVTIGGKWEGALDALTVTTDVAAGANIDLSAAALLVGKAIAGETSSLSRYGIQLEKGATQTEIMAALTKQFGGSAAAAADPMTQLKNRLGDLLQVLGDQLLPIVVSITTKVEVFTRRIIAWTEAHPKLTKVLLVGVVALGALALVVGPLLIMLPGLAIAFTAVGVAVHFMLGPIGIISLALTAFAVAYATNFLGIRDITNKVVGFIVGLYESWLGWFLPGGAVIKAIVFLARNWKELVQGMADAFTAFVNVFIGDANRVINALNLIPGVTIPAIEEMNIVLFKSREQIGLWGDMMNDAATTARKVAGATDEVVAAIGGIGGGGSRPAGQEEGFMRAESDRWTVWAGIAKRRAEQAAREVAATVRETSKQMQHLDEWAANLAVRGLQKVADDQVEAEREAASKRQSFERENRALIARIQIEAHEARLRAQRRANDLEIEEERRKFAELTRLVESGGRGAGWTLNERGERQKTYDEIIKGIAMTYQKVGYAGSAGFNQPPPPVFDSPHEEEEEGLRDPSTISLNIDGDLVGNSLGKNLNIGGFEGW